MGSRRYVHPKCSRITLLPVKETCNQKHLSMLSDLKLDCQEHFKSLIKKKIKQLFCHVNS